MQFLWHIGMRKKSTPPSERLAFCQKAILSLLLGLFIFSYGSSQTVIIPRDGFPYCEPFTKSSTRANTELGLSANLTAKSGVDFEGEGFLRLTSGDTQNDRGYAFVDLPFASNYGIRVSFEYFAYGGIDPLVRADGLSFFLFDGDISKTAFQIGGRGGSLGYAPHQYSNGSGYQPGLKGGFFGLGFDSFKNFGNEYEGKTGGFTSSSKYASETGSVPSFKEFPNSIVIRGPESDNYVFISGKRTNNYPMVAHENPDLVINPNPVLNLSAEDYVWTSNIPPLYPIGPPEFALRRRFSISSNVINRAENCNEVGYRKVFIELKPASPLDGFFVTVYMIVNTDATPTGSGNHLNLETIFKEVYYPYKAFENLKLGFAAATGDKTAYHEIRNVKAEVFEIANLKAPIIDPIPAKEICVNSTEGIFQFQAISKSDNSFIRCVQLTENPSNEIPPPNPKSAPTILEDCGFDGASCENLCDPQKQNLKVSGGEFIVDLIPDPSDPTGERKIASIRFIPDAGFVGEAVGYLQVIDNYGFTSASQEIRAIINPLPILSHDPTIVNPSCNGQNDGQISSLIVGDLVNGFDYEWIYNGVSQGKSNATVTSLTADGKATFSLSNINIGTYTLKVWNPSDNGRCEFSFSVPITQEKGTPVEVEVNDKVICEGQVVDFNPVINPAFGNDSGAKFFWYTSANRVGGPITNGSTRVIDGKTISFKITNDRVIEISGLTPNGSTPKSYQFFVEAQSASNPSGNFCPYIGDVLAVAKVTVFPPINFTATKVSDDWCLDGGGRINATVSNPSSPISYTLLNGTGNVVSTNTTGQFPGLSKGTYEVFATSSNPSCTSVSIPLTIDGPNSDLSLVFGSVQNSFCNLPNGVFDFTLSGGNLPYTIKVDGSTISSLTPAGNLYTITNLSSGSHTLEIIDAKGCVELRQFQINADPLPSFNTTSDEICVGEDAVIEPVIVNQSSSTPVFSWYASDGAGGYLPITNSSTFNGAKFSINPSTSVLTVSGLAASATPYTYYLQVTGSKTCNNAYLPAQIKVNAGPALSPPSLKMVECFGQSTGAIQAAVTAGNLTDFQFSLTGNNGVNIPFTSNSGLFQNLLAGIYTLSIKNSSGCITSISAIEITQPAELKIGSKDVSDATCGENNGTWTVDVTGGTLKPGDNYQLTFDGQPVAGLGANFITNSPGNYTVKGISPGTHTIDVKDSNNCSISISQLFLARPVPKFETEDLVICEGQTGVLIPQIVDQAGSTPTFSWSLEDPSKPGSFVTINSGDKIGSVTYTISNGQLTVEGLAPQAAPYIYYLSVSGNLVCPASPIPAEIKVVKNPEATFEIEKVSCFGASDGAIRLLSSTPSTDLTYTLVEKGQSNSTGIFSGLQAGSYTIAVKNLSGCEITVPLEVPQPTAPIQINKPDILRSSCDLENGSIENLVISGGWGNYTVTWKKGSLTGTTITGSATEVKNLGPGTYYLIIKDEEGCEVSFSFVIEESSDPEYAIVPPINVCLGQPVSIRPVHLAPNPSLPPASPTEVQWYTGPGKTGLISNGADPSTPSISYAIDDTDWLNPELEVTGLPAGVHDFYFYVVCTGKESKIEVTVYEVPKVELELTPITCFGNTNGKVKITSGALPVYTYTVNGGAPLSQTAFEALNLGAGVYNLEVNTPAGCAQKTTFEVLGPSAALSSTTMTKVDPGCNAPNGKLEFTLSGGWLPYTLEVIKNGTSLGTQTTSTSAVVLNGYTSGVYQVKVTDARGCTITTNTVTLVDGPTQIAVQDAEICVGGTAVLTPTIDPVAPGAVFSWFLDAGLTQKINSSATPAADGRVYLIDGTGALSVSNLPARIAPYVYYVTATGPGVCAGFVERAEVKVYDLPIVSSVIKNEVCFGDGGEITVQASGGSGNYSYSLNGGPFGTTNTFKVPIGNYQVEVRTKEGCAVILSGLLVSGPTSSLTATDLQQDSPTCGQSNGAVRFQILGGYSPYTVSWMKDGVISGSQNVAGPGQATVSNLGVGNYTFQVRDNSGCLVGLPNSFTLVEVPTVISISDDKICEGELAELIPSLPQNITNPIYSWSFDAGGNSKISDGMTLDGARFNISSSGVLTIEGLKGTANPYKYYITASGNGICNVSPKEVKVQVFSYPNLRVSNPSVVCDPKGTVDLTDYIEGFNPSIYDYSVLSPSGGSMQLNELENVSLSGDYRVSSSIKGSGCWNQPLRIRVLIADELLKAEFNYEVDLGNGILIPNAEVQIQENVQFYDFSLGKAIIWNWDFGDGKTSTAQNPTHQYQNKGTYTVSLQVIDSLGCISTFERLIVVSDDYRIMVPNAFTPEGVKNKTFKPYTRGIASMEFYIFNTWGELLYKSESLEDQGWDGMHNGKPAQNGNYVYRGKFTSRSGEISERSGVFVLIR